ncbi:hypothetical protein MNBD_GAMMA12-1687 [hydrothermal vent metagenome]|uniref:FtsH ternary system domain-containing protein n=1 Tax=hydrothermal vent metagenome TaxID=652676 RepID=A0A3B0XVF7_9ZZZZ
MAKVKLSLVWNKETRKRDIIVDYLSDGDALAMEHESDHKALINKLIEGGLLQAEEAGLVITQRETEKVVDVSSEDAVTQEVRESTKSDH